MVSKMQHIQRNVYIAAVLLCCLLCHFSMKALGRSAEQVTEEASYMEVMHDMPHAAFSTKDTENPYSMHKMGQWGIPSTLVTIQGTLGRTLTANNAMQRISRTYSILHAGDSCPAHEYTEALCRLISTKRFQTGYYIHYRCQMRC